MRRVAARIAANTGSRQPDRIAVALRRWIASRTRFVADPVRDELLHDPLILLHDIARTGVAVGDCDDVATLAATMAESVGVPARFVVLAFDDPAAPFGHVYTEVATPVGWVELDTTREISIHERDRRTSRRAVWPVGGGGDMNGMGCADCGGACSMADIQQGLGRLGATGDVVVIRDDETLPPGEWECVTIDELAPTLAGLPWWVVLGLGLALLSGRRAR